MYKTMIFKYFNWKIKKISAWVYGLLLSTKKSHGPKKEKEKGTWTFEFVNFYLFLVHPTMFLPYGLCVHQSYYVSTLEE